MNGGLLCVAMFGNKLHCLIGAEYRKKSSAALCEADPILQLSIPGGKHQAGETTIDTVLREFWEETARIVDCNLLRSALQYNARGFDFPRGWYHLKILQIANSGHGGLDQHIVRRFQERVLIDGYPSECCQQLHWIPWTELRRAVTNNTTLQLQSPMLEPYNVDLSLSDWAIQVLGSSDVYRYLNFVERCAIRQRYANERLEYERKMPRNNKQRRRRGQR